MNRPTQQISGLEHPLLIEAERLGALLLPEEVAQILNVSPNTLAYWRSTGRHNLKFEKYGRSVRYKPEVIRQFLQQRLANKRN